MKKVSGGCRDPTQRRRLGVCKDSRQTQTPWTHTRKPRMRIVQFPPLSNEAWCLARAALHNLRRLLRDLRLQTTMMMIHFQSSLEEAESTISPTSRNQRRPVLARLLKPECLLILTLFLATIKMLTPSMNETRPNACRTSLRILQASR